MLRSSFGLESIGEIGEIGSIPLFEDLKEESFVVVMMNVVG
jgi:hypothetical protein